MRNKNSLTLTPEGIRRYAVHLLEQERAAQRRERSGKQPRDGRSRAPVKYRNKP